MNRWSLEEEKYLRDNWGHAAIKIIMQELERTEDSIIRKAKRMGLDTHKSLDTQLRKRWTKEEERLLTQFYSEKSVAELEKLLPFRTKDSIVKKAKLLGLSTENKYWNEDEIIYLEEKWGVVPIENIAKKLKRTRNAVLLKAHKIGLREQIIANGEYLTPKDVSSILGVGTKTVYNWMGKGYIKYRRLKINSVKKYQITIGSFKTFLEKHQDKWDGKKADVTYIGTCFSTARAASSNVLPEWFAKKIKADKEKRIKLRRKQWTVKEELSLRSMINGGKSYKEIAALLNRSFYSIQGKITRGMNEYL